MIQLISRCLHSDISQLIKDGKKLNDSPISKAKNPNDTNPQNQIFKAENKTLTLTLAILVKLSADLPLTLPLRVGLREGQ